ncbi:MAG: ComEC/Rec2 family competence protein [Candidatus Paceibacterota bacterium]|jgi:competence protein ComEC
MTKREVIIILILVIIALSRFFFFLPERPSYDRVLGESVTVEGIVTDAPDVRLFNQRIVVRPTNQKSNILVVAPKEVDILYGDKIKVKGVLETPENFMTSAGKEFNYERYLANQDIYFIINNAEVEIISRGNGNWIKSQLFKLRNFFMENIQMVISSPEKDLANGLILGARGGFDSRMKDEFISTGTIHIVALSGYNISIVSENVMKFFGLFLSQTLSIIFGVFVIILFIIMTGAQATAIRAGIMASIVLLARLTGRTSQAGRILVIAGLLMITYDLRVVTDMSFQLSFLATGGILFITPKVMKWVSFMPMRFKLRETVATTIGATIAVLPLILFSTGVLSIVSLPANILILPVIPYTMLFNFLTGIVGFISPTLSMPFAFISDLLLSYILGVVHFFAGLPFASVTIKSFPLVVTILLYVLLFWLVFKKTTKTLKNKF